MAQLKLNDIIKLAEDTDKVEKLYLDKEKDEYITYYPNFSETKIDDVLKELALTIDECQETKNGLIDNDEKEAQYLEFLIVKHFTSLKDELDGQSLEVHSKTKDALYKSGLLRLLLDNIFDQTQINKVLDKKNNIVGLLEKVANELERNALTENLNKLQIVDKLVN